VTTPAHAERAGEAELGQFDSLCERRNRVPLAVLERGPPALACAPALRALNCAPGPSVANEAFDPQQDTWEPTRPDDAAARPWAPWPSEIPSSSQAGPGHGRGDPELGARGVLDRLSGPRPRAERPGPGDAAPHALHAPRAPDPRRRGHGAARGPAAGPGQTPPAATSHGCSRPAARSAGVAITIDGKVGTETVALEHSRAGGREVASGDVDVLRNGIAGDWPRRGASRSPPPAGSAGRSPASFWKARRR
jgi:hypothetical protein